MEAKWGCLPLPIAAWAALALGTALLCLTAWDWGVVGRPVSLAGAGGGGVNWGYDAPSKSDPSLSSWYAAGTGGRGGLGDVERRDASGPGSEAEQHRRVKRLLEEHGSY